MRFRQGSLCVYDKKLGLVHLAGPMYYAANSVAKDGTNDQ